jgi:hypothetical protein
MTADMYEPDEGWMVNISSEGRKTAETVAQQKTRHDLVALVGAWASSVRGIVVDKGEDYYDDYWIYLSWREIIDDVIAALPERDASILRNAVLPADTAFQKHTVDDGGAAMSRKFTVPKDRWYWRRVPTRGPIAESLGTAKDE